MTPAARRGPRRARRGAGFLTLLLVAFPLMLFGLSLSMDYGRALYVNRQAADVAEAVSMAGATGFSTTTYGELDPTEATSRARDMYAQALSSGMIASPDAITYTGSRILNQGRSIRATLQVHVPLVIPSVIIGILGGNSDTFAIDSTIERTASVCQESNLGGCMYPVDVN